MGSRFRYSGKTEFQSTMIRAQQMNLVNDSKSTFERRPSQRFVSRRSRMDRTRPNITSSSSSNAATATVKSSNNTNKDISSNNNNNHSNKDNTNSSVIKNDLSINRVSAKQHSEIQQSSPSLQQPAVKPNLVINSGSSRHQLSHGKPVKPPTVPSSVSFSGITQQNAKTTTNQQQHCKSSILSAVNSNNNNSNNINNNNINHQLVIDRKSEYTSDSDTNHHVKSINRSDQPGNMQINSSHAHSKSQPASIKSHHNYINYKPPDTQPPPPPKTFDNPKDLQQQTKTIKSEDDQSDPSLTIKKPGRQSTSNTEKHSEVGAVITNGLLYQRTQQQGELMNSSRMPPPPPPPHTTPRSISSQVLNQLSKQSQQHAQNGGSMVIKPICVTEL